MKKPLFLLCLLFFAAPKGLAKEKVYTHSLNGTPKNLDPVSVESYYGSLLLASIYDTLYTYKYLKRPYELKPSLAKKMPDISQDGLTYTISLKEGIYFADDPAFPHGKGREVLASDFVYSIKRHMDPKNRSTSRSSFENILGLLEWQKSLDYDKEAAGLKALGPYKLQIILTQKNPRFLYELASVSSAVVPREAVQKYGRELAIRPVGSGPFRLLSFNSSQAVLVKNKNYRADYFSLKEEGYDSKTQGVYGLGALEGRKMPFVDKLVVKFMKQTSSRWQSFHKGNEVQYAVVPPEEAASVLKPGGGLVLKDAYAKKFILKPEEELGLTFGTFNMANPKIGHHADPVKEEKNRKLRCAMRKAFHWDARINRFYFGLGKAYSGAISPGLPGYSKLPLDSVTYDVAGGRRLLGEAGFTAKSLPTIVYGGTSSVKVRQMYEQFRGFMKKIGYPSSKIKFKASATFGDYIKAVNNGKYDFYAMGWVPSLPDPLQLMERYSSQHKSPGSNKAMFENKAFDALYQSAKFMEDGPKRTEKFRQMNAILNHQCVAIESFSRTTLHIWHRNVKMNYTGNMLRNIFKFIDVDTKTVYSH